MYNYHRAMSIALMSLVLIGCTGEKPRGGNRTKTTPVVGTVMVDGSPTPAVIVTAHPDPGNSEAKVPLITATDGEGKFAFATYQAGDGLPNGTYKLTFVWEEISLVFQTKKNDHLGGAYADPKKSEISVTVDGGKMIDMGTINLVTKKANTKK